MILVQSSKWENNNTITEAPCKLVPIYSKKQLFMLYKCKFLLLAPSLQEKKCMRILLQSDIDVIILLLLLEMENIPDVFCFTLSVATAPCYLYSWFRYSLLRDRRSSDRRSIQPYNSRQKGIVSK